MSEFHDWFNCPNCGDSGETKLFLVGGNGGVEFTCESREHQLNTRRYHKFEREEWRYQDDSHKSLLSQFLSPRPLFGSLHGLTTCPYCDSGNTDGAIEALKIEKNYETYALITATVWCHECNKSDRSTLSHGQPRFDSEMIANNSSFPPEYV